MPAVLETRVYLYPKMGKFPTQAAVLELNPDNTVRLTTIDPDSGTRRNVIFDESLSDIQIGGAGTSLTFSSRGGDTWRVDFSPYNAGQWVITAEQANNVYMNRADIGVWVAKLKELGYPARYRNAPNIRIIATVLVLVAIVIVVLIVLAALRHPVFS